MVYKEIECSCLDSLVDEINVDLVDSNLKFKYALKVFPQVTTEFARRTGIVHALHTLDLIDDAERDEMVNYLKSEMELLHSLIGKKKKVKL